VHKRSNAESWAIAALPVTRVVHAAAPWLLAMLAIDALS